MRRATVQRGVADAGGDVDDRMAGSDVSELDQACR